MEQNPQDEKIDPLKRIFVPLEKGRDVNGNWTFKTSDGEAYYRLPDGSIRRKYPKEKRRRHGSSSSLAG